MDGRVSGKAADQSDTEALKAQNTVLLAQVAMLKAKLEQATNLPPVVGGPPAPPPPPSSFFAKEPVKDPLADLKAKKNEEAKKNGQQSAASEEPVEKPVEAPVVLTAQQIRDRALAAELEVAVKLGRGNMNPVANKRLSMMSGPAQN